MEATMRAEHSGDADVDIEHRKNADDLDGYCYYSITRASGRDIIRVSRKLNEGKMQWELYLTN